MSLDMSSVQMPVESIPSTQALKESQRSTKFPLECNQWMNDLRTGLTATFKARDANCNKIRSKVLYKHAGQIQSKLREKLAKKKSTLARFLQNRPRLHRHSGAL